MQYPDSYKEVNSSKLCASLATLTVPLCMTVSQMLSSRLLKGNISLRLPAMCFWTYPMLLPVSAGLLCVLLYLSMAEENKPSKQISMDGFLLHWVIKHLVGGSVGHQHWQMREKTGKNNGQ